MPLRVSVTLNKYDELDPDYTPYRRHVIIGAKERWVTFDTAADGTLSLGVLIAWLKKLEAEHAASERKK